MDNLDVCFTTSCVMFPLLSLKGIHRQNIIYFVLQEIAIVCLDVILSDVFIVFYCGVVLHKFESFC